MWPRLNGAGPRVFQHGIDTAIGVIRIFLKGASRRFIFVKNVLQAPQVSFHKTRNTKLQFSLPSEPKRLQSNEAYAIESLIKIKIDHFLQTRRGIVVDDTKGGGTKDIRKAFLYLSQPAHNASKRACTFSRSSIVVMYRLWAVHGIGNAYVMIAAKS